MKRLTPLNVAAGLVVAALAAALVAAGAGAGAATPRSAAAKTRPAGTFRQALAAKLGEQLHKPAADVLAAMKTANRARGGGGGRTERRARRAARLTARAKRLTARAHALKASKRTAGAARARRAQRAQTAIAARNAWAAALAGPLGVGASDVTAALRALVAQRLDSLVHDGWLTSDRRDAELACFDDASDCAGVGRPPGLALLRAGL
jgi:hypothetical protein